MNLNKASSRFKIDFDSNSYLQKNTPRNSNLSTIFNSKSLLMFSIVSSFIWYKSHVSSSLSSLGSPNIKININCYDIIQDNLEKKNETTIKDLFLLFTIINTRILVFKVYDCWEFGDAIFICKFFIIRLDNSNTNGFCVIIYRF